MNCTEYITVDETDCEEDSSGIHSESVNSPTQGKRARQDDDCNGRSNTSPKRLAKKSCGEHPPCLSVSFNNMELFQAYGEKLKSLIMELLAEQASVNVENVTPASFHFYTEPSGVLHRDDSVVDNKDDDVHILDDAPLYDISFSGVVGTDAADTVACIPNGKNVCFNCQGNHMLSDCDVPRDAARIAKNRRQHAGSSSAAPGRYHQEAEQRFSHVRAGRISTSLRRALGIGSRQLPEHIYRMRLLGYPPGWLQAAEVHASHLSVVTDADQQPRSAGDSSNKVIYDASRLISFVGFNEPASRDVRDDYRRAGAPPFDYRQSLHRMRRELSAVRSASSLMRPSLSRHHLDLPDASDVSAARRGVGSDEVIELDDEDDANQQLEVVDVDDDEETGHRKSESENGADQSDSIDPALEDGEISDNLSLQELQSRHQSLLSSLHELNGVEIEPLVRSPKTQPLAQSTPCLRRTLAATTASSDREGGGGSLRVDLGTPVSLSQSAGSLPDVDKWSAGITQHLPFENLPGATGTWNRMRSLVDRVRSRVKAITGDK